MKKFLHKLPIWASVFSVLFCSVLSVNIQPSFATSSENLVVPWSDSTALVSPYGFLASASYSESFSYEGSLVVCLSGDNTNLQFLSPGSYFVSGVSPVGNVVTNSNEAPLAVTVVYYDNLGNTTRTKPLSFNEQFTVGENEYVAVIAQSYDSTPVLYEVFEPTPPLYYSAYQMLADFIYGEGAELTTEQNLTMTILATALSLLVVLLPFIIVYALIILFGRY